VVGLVAGAFEDIEDAVEDSFDTILDDIKTYMQEIKTRLSARDSYVSGMQSNWGAVWITMKDKVKDAWRGENGIVGIISSGIASIKDKLSGASTGFSSAFDGIKNAFAGPVNWVISNVINRFIGDLNSFSNKLGLGTVFGTFPLVPTAHSGGIVGKDKFGKTDIGKLGSNEQLMVLKKGEGVVPSKAMGRFGSESQFRRFIGGGEAGFGGGLRGMIPTEMELFPTRTAKNELAGHIWRTLSDGLAKAIKKFAEYQYKLVEGAGRFAGTKGLDWAEQVVKFIDATRPTGYTGRWPLPDAIFEEVARMQGQIGSAHTLKKYLELTGVPFSMVGMYANRNIRGTNKKSLHSFWRAIDVAGPEGFGPLNTDAMGRIFHAFKPIEKFLNFMVYSGPQTDYYVSGGMRRPKSGLSARNLKDHMNHVHIDMGEGGIIKARAGGTLVRGGEKGYDEAIIPLPKFPIEQIEKMFRAPVILSDSMLKLNASMGRERRHSARGGMESHYHIQVENFIGQREWFDSMMQDLEKTVVPARQRARGIINRKVSSYSDNRVRY